MAGPGWRAALLPADAAAVGADSGLTSPQSLPRYFMRDSARIDWLLPAPFFPLVSSQVLIRSPSVTDSPLPVSVPPSSLQLKLKLLRAPSRLTVGGSQSARAGRGTSNCSFAPSRR